MGRHRELVRIADLLADVAQGEQRCLVLEGEAGIGKTRLLDETLGSIQPAPGTVAWYRCSDKSPAPLDDLETLLSSCLGEEEGRQAMAGLKQSSWTSINTHGDELPAVRARGLALLVNRILDSIDDAEPLMIVVDDLHWVHVVALRFLEILVDSALDRSGDLAFGLLVATRPLPTDHAAWSLFNRLVRSAATEHVAVSSLSRLAAEEVVRDELDLASPALLSIVHRSARGNPLRIRALLELIGGDRDSDGDGEKAAVTDDQLRRLVRIQVPFDGRDPVVAWLERMPDEDRLILAACAALNARFDLEMAAVAIGRPLGETADLLDRPIHAAVLATDGVEVWFAHPQYREVLYDSMGMLERQRIHARCAVHLIESATYDSSSMAAGHHIVAAGDRLAEGDRSADALGRSVAWPDGAAVSAALVAAGDAALVNTAWSDAVRFYLAALRHDQVPDIGDLHWRLGQAFYFDNDSEAAERHLRLAVAEAAHRDRADQWCSSIVMLMRTINSMQSAALRNPAERELVDAFLEEVSDPLLNARVIEVLAEGRIGAGLVDEGLDLAERALRLAEESGEPQILALSHFAKGYGEMSRAHIKPALIETEAALSLAREAGDWFIELAIQSRRCFALLASGRVAEADLLAADAVRAAVEQNLFSVQALAGAIRAAVSLLRGDFALARQQGEVAAAAGRRSGHNVAGIFLAPIRVQTELALNDPLAAKEELDRWSLPKGIESRLSEMIALRRGQAVLPRPSSKRNNRVNLIEGGLLALRGELAIAQRERDELVNVLDQLETFDRLGCLVPPSFPTVITRLIGDLHAELGQIDEAAAAYRQAVGVCQREGLLAEQARAIVGLALVEASRAGSTRDDVHRLATQGEELADRLGLAGLRDRASAVRSSAIDTPAAVDARGGAWRVILATDLVASTRISNTQGDRSYHRMVVDHHRLVEGVVAHFDGHIFQDSGDGLYAWFESTDNAAAAARAVVADFVAHDVSPLAPKVKVALAGGDPFFDGGRPYGLVVNRTARVLDFAEPGEVLVDEALAAAVPVWATTADERLEELRGIGLHRISRLVIPPDHLIEKTAK